MSLLSVFPSQTTACEIYKFYLTKLIKNYCEGLFLMERLINTAVTVIFDMFQTLFQYLSTDSLHSSSLESAMPLKEGT